MSTPAVGARVRIERDETRFPSRGSWPRFRGKTGTVVETNRDEFGVVFGKVWPREDRPGVLRWSGQEPITWFRAHEIKQVARASQRRSAGRTVAA